MFMIIGQNCMRYLINVSRFTTINQHAGILEKLHQRVVNGTLSEASFNDIINSLNLNQ